MTMKRISALILMLLILLCAHACAEEIIINKTKGEHADFSFAQDAKLLEIYFPPIFGCDAAYIRCGDKSMLIDCAGNQWKTAKAMLDKLGVTELTYALNTHPDADHIGGFNHVLKEIPAGEFLMGFPEEHDSGDEVRFKVYNALHELNIPMRRVGNGDTIDFGDVSITVYQRLEEHLPRVNSKSLTLMIRYGERSIYFTGDVLHPGQELLAEHNGADLDADILKYPHHGLEPMREVFLNAISPELVIATSGKSDVNGIQDLKKRKIPYMLTANRTTYLATDGKVWVVEAVK